MKIKQIAAAFLTLTAVLTAGCGGKSDNTPVISSENFEFTRGMATYMASYTHLMLTDEMKAAGVDTKKPLSEQERSDGESWADYIYSKTLSSMEDILLYCEAALTDRYTVSEGMNYKANETLSYISGVAGDLGISSEEYLKKVYGNGVTVENFSLCTQMMALCEGYDLELTNGMEVTDEEATAYADENPDKFLKFDALRYTTKDKDLADRLAAAASREEYLKIMSGVSGTDLTDSDKNGIPDTVEVRNAVVASDADGGFAMEDARKIGDTRITEKDGEYTVTMLLSLPSRKSEPLWDYLLIYISSESSTDPAGDAASLLDQWKEKDGKEDGFSTLAARYSDDPMAYYGGLYSGVSADGMATESIAEWMCDTSRIYGDTTVIPDGENGAYMLYFIKGSTKRWMHEATTALKNDMAKEKIDSVRGDIEAKYELDEATLRDIVKSVLDETVEGTEE